MTEPFDAVSQLAVLDADVITLERSRIHLPARVALSELGAAVEELDRGLQLLESERQPLDATLSSLEEEASRLGTREKEIATILEASTGASRELEAMDAEVHRLAKTRSDLEDRELELLEALEPLEQRQSALIVERGGYESEQGVLAAQVKVEEDDLDAQLTERRRERGEVASGIESGLLARYDKLASRSDGVGAAKLEHGHCSGCHLSLASVELDHLRKMPIEEIAYCEQCSRILLRPEQLG